MGSTRRLRKGRDNGLAEPPSSHGGESVNCFTAISVRRWYRECAGISVGVSLSFSPSIGRLYRGFEPRTGSPRCRGAQKPRVVLSLTPSGNSLQARRRCARRRDRSLHPSSLGHAGRSDAKTAARLAVRGRRAHQTWRKLIGGNALGVPRSRRLFGPIAWAGNHCSMS